MGIYNRKCQGCGNWLSNNPDDAGYIANFDDNKKFCVRCFKINNYGKMIVKVDNQKIEDELANLDPKSHLVILVVNLFDLHNSLYEKAKEFKNVVIAVNNGAALPKRNFHENIIENIRTILETEQFFPIDVVLYDAIDKFGIGAINDYISQAYQLKKKIYIIGKTNVGKSTLINALLKYNKINKKLTVSPFKNTTLSYNKVKIGKTEIIDTPGFPNEKNILNNLASNDLKNIHKNKPEIKTYQIKDEQQMFFIEKLFGFIAYKKSEEAYLTFYSCSKLNIHRSKPKNIDSIIENEQLDFIKFENLKKFNLKKEEINEQIKYNLLVPGIGIISFAGIGQLDLFVPEGINYFLIDYPII